MCQTRRRAGRGRNAQAVVGDANAHWVVAGRSAGDEGMETTWMRFALCSSPGRVWRMDNTVARQDVTRTGPATISTLADTLETVAGAPTPANSALVLFSHGIEPRGVQDERWLSLDSGVSEDATLDENSDPHVLPVGWEVDNTHYRRVKQAIQRMSNITQVHLYGCCLGNRNNRAPLRRLSEQLGKEVWAYYGRTNFPSHTRGMIDHSTSDTGQPQPGTRQQDGSYVPVTLETSHGLFPGWQMRAINGRVVAYSPGEVAPEVLDDNGNGTPIMGAGEVSPQAEQGLGLDDL